MRAELTEDLFNKIIDDLQNSSDSLDTILDNNNTTKYMFYKVVGSDEAKANRYVHARAIYIENRLSEREKIMRDAINDAKCFPKAGNAIVNAAREICRQIEYNCEKLLPHKYGARINMDDNTLKIMMIQQNVSNNPIASNTNNNDKITVE